MTALTMALEAGQPVRHSTYGDGRIVRLLGSMAVVDFMGEEIDVEVDELEVTRQIGQSTESMDGGSAAPSAAKVAFRKSYEAMVLGVVPPDPEELIRLTIGGRKREADVRKWLKAARTRGLCKVVFGYYGSGKSHYLNFARCVALTEGWVVAFLELDPAAADPAKPNLVYNQIMQRLQFPKRAGVGDEEGVGAFLAEVRRHWRGKALRANPQLQGSPWLRTAIEALVLHGDTQSEDYQVVAQYIAGAPNTVTTLRQIARLHGLGSQIQAMRSTGETAAAYVHNLAVIDGLCRGMGYKGLCVIMDEAEHYRNLSTRRRERASNFLDVLGRAAHRPNPTLPSPEINDLDRVLGDMLLDEGPHFALFVGLTRSWEAAGGTDGLHESCVLLHDEGDQIDLTSPSVNDYRDWCTEFLARFAIHYREEMVAILDPVDRDGIVDQLTNGFASLDGPPNSSLRHWIKLATLAPATLFANPEMTIVDLQKVLSQAINRLDLPWED